MRNKLKSFRRWLMNHPEANEEETTKYLRDRSLFGLLDFINAVYEYYDYIDFKGANEMLCNTLRYCLLVNIFPSISGVGVSDTMTQMIWVQLLPSTSMCFQK